MTAQKVNRSLAARLELRHALADLVQRFPRLTTPEAQERAREFIESLDENDCDPKRRGDGEP